MGEIESDFNRLQKRLGRGSSPAKLPGQVRSSLFGVRGGNTHDIRALSRR
jgi:hypothetical protein